MKGHIVKRSENSYSIKLDLGRDPSTGARRQKWFTVEGNKKKAEAELARLLNEINIGTFVEPAKLTVASYLDRWLEDYVSVNLAGKSTERISSAIKHHVKPALGALPLHRLAPLHLQSFYAAALKPGARKDGREGSLSPQTVLHFHRILFQALKQAVRWQLLARNPAEAVEPPKVRRPEVAVLDEHRSAFLLDAALGTRLYIPVMLAITAGLRRGEILALRWQDVGFESGLLWIRRAVEQTKQEIRIKEPKSRQGRRSVALPPLAMEALKAHLAGQQERRALLGAAYQDNDLVCCVEDGSLWKPSAFTSAYRDLLRRRKLDGPNFHALRHSHASQLLRAGIDMKVISSRLGHSRTAFTADTYIHLLPGQDQEAARRIEQALRPVIGQKRTPANGSTNLEVQ
ncbi:MAG: tyrosine-type recombinase/integrase [Bryobacterales bacterium]|nr:tyrosine-type recombinase/integrase [Bryobacterales bacterium]